MFTQRCSATRHGATLARRLAVWKLDTWGILYGTRPCRTALAASSATRSATVSDSRVPYRIP
ncbi:ATP-binding protein, partial [Streptomyces laculatispora]|nr:ATP-binding protein [Streptomyces laculatispora]